MLVNAPQGAANPRPAGAANGTAETPRLAAEPRPQPLPATPSTTRQSEPLLWDLLAGPAGHGLTPQRVNCIFRDAECGRPQDQVDMFEHLLENDGHLRGVALARQLAVAGKTWVIQPGGEDSASVEAAAALTQYLTDSGNFADAIQHQLDAVSYGYAGSEIVWDYRDGLWYPCWFYNVPHRRWVFDPLAGTGELRITTMREMSRGEALTPGSWMVTKMRHTNPARAGLMRTATWFAMFKRYAVRDFTIKSEKHGIPPVLGFYGPDSGKEGRQEIEKAVKDIGEAGQAVLPEGTRISFGEVGGTAQETSGVHRDLILLCEAQMSKLYTGSVLTADTGGPGSFALGQVHANVRFDVVLSDAARLSDVFARDIGAPFCLYNGFTSARPPKLKFHIVAENDQVRRMQVFKSAQELGYPVDTDQVSEEMALRPANGNPLRERPLIGQQPVMLVKELRAVLGLSESTADDTLTFAEFTAKYGGGSSGAEATE